MKNRTYYIVDLTTVVEADGTLVAAETGRQIPFPIHRIFCVKNVAEGKSRGDHATKKTKLVLVPVAGFCEVVVDDGQRQEVFQLDSSGKGLYIDEMIWRSMRNFSPDCVMLAMADRVFEPGNETYDDYDTYREALNRGE